MVVKTIDEAKIGEESVLTDDYLRGLISVGEVDILVGLPTHNNAKDIGGILETIQAGIIEFFPRERAAIINADGGSRDGTPEIIRSASISDVRHSSKWQTLRTLPAISTNYTNNEGSNGSLRTILSAADLLRAKACVVVSPQSINMTTKWLANLVRPVFHEKFDLALPTYARHPSEGILITNLLYPMTRALYGQRVREPYASEFAFSGRLASEFLANNAWNEEPARAGPDCQLALAAILGGYRVCQSFLGPKLHVERSAADLVPAMRRTVGPLFSSMAQGFQTWSATDSCREIVTNGPEQEFTADAVRVNRKRLRDMFATGVSDLAPVFQSILSPSTLEQLRTIAKKKDDGFEYPSELWVKTIYEFASAYHHSVINRDHIIQALAPLFRGRAAVFSAQNGNENGTGVEDNIEKLCLEFEQQKPYLKEMWNEKK